MDTMDTLFNVLLGGLLGWSIAKMYTKICRFLDAYTDYLNRS